jgi:gliding motility-associated-like protein
MDDKLNKIKLKTKRLIFFIFAVLLLIFCQQIEAQIIWNQKNIFEPKLFVENKGQNESDTLPNHEPILYTANIDGLTYFFTKQGFTLFHLKTEELIGDNSDSKEIDSSDKDEDEDEDKNENEEEEEENEKRKYKLTKEYLEFRLLNTNPETEIISGNSTDTYYSFADVKNPQRTTLAHTCKKITYKNIYPGIDLFFEFPNDSTGIKCSVYLHPGADVEKIKIDFPGRKFSLRNNSIEIASDFGNIIQHLTSFTSTKNKLRSDFKRRENYAGLAIETNQNKVGIIDLWIATPVFESSNSAFDVDYDSKGNVYVFGGSGWSPYRLLKYNPSGSLIWTYISPSNAGLYGDFTIDRNSNTIYLAEGLCGSNAGTQIVKINSDAIQLATFEATPILPEMWRIAYSECHHLLIIAGGGPLPSSQIGTLDTNLLNFNPIKFVPNENERHDIALLALDQYGDCYMGTVFHWDGLFSNQLIKFPLPSILPVIFNVDAYYNFIEANSLEYFTRQASIGYNGLTTSNRFVYSYDSYTVRKWNGKEGQLLKSKQIHYPLPTNTSKMYWGGISSDECGNLFVADSNMVKQYDSTLNLVNTYTMPGVITDVKISNKGILYTCGLGFVAAIEPSNVAICEDFKINIKTVNATCNTSGSASVSVMGGAEPYTIVWNTNPVQHSTTISNLQPGNYSVSVIDGSCKNLTLTNTFTISGEDPVESATVNIPCGEDYKLPWGVVVNQPGTYNDTLKTMGGCDSIVSRILTYDVSSLDLKTLIPNAFSPNDDGINDQLCFPSNHCFDKINMAIYDRWGERIFETNSLKNCWDGTYKGKKLESAVFVYYLTVKFTDGVEETLKGNISLIK